MKQVLYFMTGSAADIISIILMRMGTDVTMVESIVEKSLSLS